MQAVQKWATYAAHSRWQSRLSTGRCWRRSWRSGHDDGVVGAVIIAVVLVVVLPVVVLMSGSLAAAALGYVLKDEAERSNEGSELIDLNI